MYCLNAVGITQAAPLNVGLFRTPAQDQKGTHQLQHDTHSPASGAPGRGRCADTHYRMSARLAARLGHWSFPIDNLSKISLWEFRFLDTSRSCTGAVDDPQRPVHFDDIGRIEQSDYSFNRIRKQGVIGVEKASNLTRAFCKPKIKCGSLSAIFLKNRDNLVSIGSHDLARTICRSIIHDHHLDRAVGLIERAVDSLP